VNSGHPVKDVRITEHWHMDMSEGTVLLPHIAGNRIFYLTGNRCDYRSGRLRLVVETVLPVSEAQRAQELGREGHVRGEIVLWVQ
jgi:hypothetical protein